MMKLAVSSHNTAYMAHFVRPNFGFAETSYMLWPLYAILLGGSHSKVLYRECFNHINYGYKQKMA